MSSWSHLGSITVPSGRLSISDSSFFYDFPLTVEVQPGTYDVHGQLVSLVGTTHLSRIRISDVPPDGLSRGRLLGHVKVDFAQVAVCDRIAMERAYEEMDATALEQLASAMSISGLSGMVPVLHTTMFVAKPGAGDLDPAVFQLLDGERRSGVELVFVEPDARRA